MEEEEEEANEEEDKEEEEEEEESSEDSRRSKSNSISEKEEKVEEILNCGVMSTINDNLECLRNETNIERHVLEIKDIKITFEKLKSINDKGEFLINQESESKKEADNSFIKGVKTYFFDKDLKPIIEKYTKEFENKKDFFKNQGYILTDDSKERLALLIHYIKNGIPVLLEGNTGTFKSRTAITAGKYLQEFGGEEDNKESKKEKEKESQRK